MRSRDLLQVRLSVSDGGWGVLVNDCMRRLGWHLAHCQRKCRDRSRNGNGYYKHFASRASLVAAASYLRN